MLIGLITKNGILIVEFANQIRERGADATTAVEYAVLLALILLAIIVPERPLADIEPPITASTLRMPR